MCKLPYVHGSNGVNSPVPPHFKHRPNRGTVHPQAKLTLYSFHSHTTLLTPLHLLSTIPPHNTMVCLFPTITTYLVANPEEVGDGMIGIVGKHRGAALPGECCQLSQLLALGVHDEPAYDVGQQSLGQVRQGQAQQQGQFLQQPGLVTHVPVVQSKRG